jgi:anti-sigma regulatory factor (Ser/Thr protein kinase)
MDAVLIERWVGAGERTPIYDEASVSIAREAALELAHALRLPEAAVASLVLIVGELGSNQLRHARDGVIALRGVEREGVAGVEVVAADRGGGILDVGASLDGGPADGGSRGLSGVQHHADEVDLDVRLGVGTCVRARKFAGRVSRCREVAILGRNCEGERVSGDDATFERRGGVLVLALADGLGHGPEAQEPARRAIGVVGEAPEASLSELLRQADVALRGTRGAVMGLVSIDESTGALVHAAVGNITTSVRGGHEGRSFSGTHGVLGSTAPRPQRVTEERFELRPRDLVALYSDGLRPRLELEVARHLASRHPMVVAQQLIERYARDNDDATVIVAR